MPAERIGWLATQGGRADGPAGVHATDHHFDLVGHPKTTLSSALDFRTCCHPCPSAISLISSVVAQSHTPRLSPRPALPILGLAIGGHSLCLRYLWYITVPPRLSRYEDAKEITLLQCYSAIINCHWCSRSTALPRSLAARASNHRVCCPRALLLTSRSCLGSVFACRARRTRNRIGELDMLKVAGPSTIEPTPILASGQPLQLTTAG